MFDTINKVFRSTLIDKFLIDCFFSDDFDEISYRETKSFIFVLSLKYGFTKAKEMIGVV